MITIELRDAAKAGDGMTEVEIFCDSEGLTLLSKQLEHLKFGSSHVHLMTSAWAGNELGEKPFGQGTILVNHLRINMLPKKME
jgi:Immunity protein 32